MYRSRTFLYLLRPNSAQIRSRFVLHGAVGVGDDDFVGHVDEEAGFDDAGDVVEGKIEGLGVVELVIVGFAVGEEAMEVGVAVVGEERGAVVVEAWGDLGAHRA